MESSNEFRNDKNSLIMYIIKNCKDIEIHKKSIKIYNKSLEYHKQKLLNLENNQTILINKLNVLQD